ncbi:hypothetical protein DRE_00056 [Drechslerella stenobrocha 248]|uniref:Uncharacterized protein n=1 Tax=Drechslerella stenobrocha 248 TaxID=1043628 RepID=W7HX40_9PEZI|nr:hypothetical protein DRE_00056 [Drechslerella stenobrocha 248]
MRPRQRRLSNLLEHNIHNHDNNIRIDHHVVGAPQQQRDSLHHRNDQQLFNPITFPGEGLDEVIDTSVDLQTTLVLSAFTPPAVTTTQTVTITPSAVLAKRTASEPVLPRAAIPKRSDGINYTTLTVYVTTFFTTSTTATLSDSAVAQTVTSTISSVATRNQTHYETPTGFTTSTIVITSTSVSYAYGTVDALTKVDYQTVTAAAPGGTETDGSVLTVVPAANGGARKVSPGGIAGIVLSVVLAVILSIIAGYIIRRKRKAADGDEKHDAVWAPPLALPAPSPPPERTVAPADAARPQSAASRKSAELPESPMSYLFFTGLTDEVMGSSSKNQHGPAARHTRRGSRNSVVTVSPVPEEDEYSARMFDPQTWDTIEPPSRRGSADASKWGRGYGGRGGYHGISHRAANDKPAEGERGA